MTAARIAAASAALALALPAAAHGHAWSGTQALSTAGSWPVADMAPSGHAIVGWRTDGGSGGAAAVAAPGGAFAVTSPAPATMGDGVEDVAIAENGDAFAAWQNQNGLHVAIRRAGEPWSGGQPLNGVGEHDSWDLAAGPGGEATVVATTAAGLLTFTRSAGEMFAAGPTHATAYGGVRAGYVGTRVAIVEADLSNVYGRTLAGDTLSAPAMIDTETGPPNSLRLATDRGGAGAVVTWPAFGSDSHMRAARAGSDAVLGSGEDVSGKLYKGVMHPSGAIASDGRVLVGWGDAEFDPVTLAAASSPVAALARIPGPPVPGNRTDDIRVAFDSRGAQMAGWYFSDNAQNGTTGRIEVATRLPGQEAWCRPETLAAHRANGYRLGLHLDGRRRGFAVWETPAGGPGGTASVWVARYEARDDCPPPPEQPPQQPREEVVVVIPEQAPTVVVTRRFVRLVLPRRATVDGRGRLRLAVRCAGEGDLCAGRLALKRRTTVWGARRFSVRRGRKVLGLQLSRPARRSLARNGGVALRIEVRLRDQDVVRASMTLRTAHQTRR